MYFGNSIFRKVRILMDNADDGKGGGGGGSDKTAELERQLADEKARNAAFEERLKKLEGGGGGGNPPPAKDEDDLAEKARKEAEAKAKTQAEQKRLEGALKFNLTLPQWTKDNASVLPKSIEGIMAQAAKETYSDAIEEANTLKVSIVGEFFAQQVNLDLLTASQKDSLDEWKKLTKTDKQARVQHIFDNIFEPTFEALKRQKKAEALSKGFGESTASEDSYKERMREISKKHYGVQ